MTEIAATPPNRRVSLPATTLHIVIDMQRLFAEATAWHTPDLTRILPQVLKLTEARPERTLFARFVVPKNPEAARGRWQAYYRRWASVTGERIDPALLDVVAPLADLATADRVFDKSTYSIFDTPAFVERLERGAADTLVFSGVETDVCVLASIFDAVDRGYRVIVPADAVASSSPAAHQAALEVLMPRLAEQIEIWDTQAVVEGWASAGPCP